MKESSIGEPSIYLGGKCCKIETKTGKIAWGFSSSQYVQEACRNVRQYLKDLNKDQKPEQCKYFMPKKVSAPLSNDHRPEIDVSPELAPEFAAYYQSLIGVLRWMV